MGLPESFTFQEITYISITLTYK